MLEYGAALVYNEMSKTDRLLDYSKPPKDACRDFATPKQRDNCVGENTF